MSRPTRPRKRISPTSAQAQHVAAGPASKRKRKQHVGDEPDALASVNPTFAQVFRGGPQREASFLPVREDEGQEVVFEEPQVVDAVGGASWLTSLGGEPPEPDAGKVESPALAVDQADDVDWLTSIGATKGKALAASLAAVDAAIGAADTSTGPSAAEVAVAAKLSKAAAAVVGKALDIPPFWRIAPKEDLERDLRENRTPLLQHMKRLSRDSHRADKRRGQMRLPLKRFGGSGGQL